ncbi:MAG: septum site-determining protein MinC [Cyanobacteria bacterium J06642_2]
MSALLAPAPLQVYFRGDRDGLHLHLPEPAISWSELWPQVTSRMQSNPLLLLETQVVTLWAGAWVLDSQRLEAMAALLANYQLPLQRVQTTCRQTAIAAATLGYSVEQTPPLAAASTKAADFATPLYLETTVRSGTAIRHAGTVIVKGDINPGGEIVAGGNILIWGRLRGIAHAGARGWQGAAIAALHFDPTQLRIANRVARAPEGKVTFPTPEVAYLQDDTICIASVSEYLRR